MVEKYGESARCWTPYIRQCIDCNTFSYSERLQRELPESVKDSLFEKMYHSTIPKSITTLEPLDSIINSYKKVFERIKECRSAKLQLSSMGAHMSWKLDDGEQHGREENLDESYPISDRYKCVINIKTYCSAEAIPVDSSKRIVRVQGVANRVGAFDGDTVIVEIFEDSPKDECYGKVLKVTKRGGNLNFVCRVSETNPIVFYPIDKKSPLFINLPRLSQHLLKKKEMVDINPSDLKCNDVVVFLPPPGLESDEVEEVHLPLIKQVIPMSVAKNMLFLVSYVKWEKKYRNPLGMVVGVFPKGFTPFSAERLLKFEHSVVFNDKEDEEQLVDVELVQEDARLKLYSQVFTIDPEGAKNLDDALSIVKLQETGDGQVVYQLGVHIVNAAKHIHAGTSEDMEAEAMGLSVYGGSKGKVMHMLPSHQLRRQLSLIPGKIRDVISVICTVTMNPSSCNALTISGVSIQPAQVKSAIKLTYAHAQEIMAGSMPQGCASVNDKFKDPSLSESIMLLYNIAFVMRRERLGPDGACVYDTNELEEEWCWQSHLLVEELMIWANSEVAKRIHCDCPDAALLRKQSSPNEEKIIELTNNHNCIMMNSLYLSGFAGASNDDSSDSNPLPLLVTFDVLQKLKKAVDNNDYARLTHLLSSDWRYPQLAVIHSELKSLFQRSEYCCTKRSKTEPSEYRHDSLKLDQYTHFSSPMRRYIDIQVQRVLLEVLRKGGEEFQHEYHKELCIKLNTKTRNSSMFEKRIGEINLSFKLLSSSEEYTAFLVKKANSKFVELQFPHLELKLFPRKATEVKISCIPTSFRIASLHHFDMTTIESALHVTQGSDSSRLADGMMKIFCVDSTTESPGDDDKSLALDIENYEFCFQKSVAEIPASQWKEALGVVKSQSTSLSKENMKRLSCLFASHKKTSLQAGNLVKSGKKMLFLDCDIKNLLKSVSILKVWLSWSMRDHMISPIVQLIEFSPLFRLCIQHSRHPAECFSDPNLSPASKPSYRNIYKYIDVWKKVLLAEAAEKSIKECKPVIIRNASLKWPQLIVPKECIHEKYYIPCEDIKMVLPLSFENDCFEFFKIWVGDMICVRYDDGKPLGTKGVFHLVVHDIKRDANHENPTVVCMEYVGVLNCRISEAMRIMISSEHCNCEVQIITMSVAYR